MDFLKAGLALAKANPAKAGQMTKTIRIDMDKSGKVLADLGKQYPNLELNEAAVLGSLEAPTGGRVVVTAMKQKAPTGGATLYYNGKLVLTGVCAGFKYNASGKKAPKAKPVEAPTE